MTMNTTMAKIIATVQGYNKIKEETITMKENKMMIAVEI